MNAIMSPRTHIKFSYAAFAAITLLCCCKCTNKLQNEVILDPKGDFQMSWDMSAENITIEVQVRTNGYVGLGFSRNGGMKAADIVIGWVVNSHVILQDRYSRDYVEPVIDNNQDYELISGFENDTHTVLRFTRLLETCDKQDLPNVDAVIFVIYAWGTDDPLPDDKIEYHGGNNRGSRQMNLMAPNVELFERTNELLTWDIPLPKVNVLPGDTTYACHVVKIPPTNKTVHIAALNMSKPAGEIKVHHFVILECLDEIASIYQEDLNVVDPYCSMQLLCPNFISWMETSGLIEIPRPYGISFGRPDRPTYYLVDIHYDNPTLRNGSVDNTTLHVITENLREYDVGTVVIMGIFDIAIPPQQSNFNYSTICPSQCTAKSFPIDGISIVNVMLHAHLTATKIFLRHFRDGVELPLIAYTNNFDTRFQTGVMPLRGVKVMPGDILAVQCEYNTMDRTNFTMGGFRSRDEMCSAIVTYYPKSELFVVLQMGPYGGLLQILENASRNFDASILTKQDVNELSYIQTYGKMDSWCYGSAGITHFTVDYPKNHNASISYEEATCEKSKKLT